MSRKTLSYILIAVGIILLVVGLFADSLGLGAVPGFGWKQIIAVVLGVAGVVVGGWMATRKSA